MKKTLFLFGMLVGYSASFAQVGIGTTSPNSKSILDLSSTSLGLLIPRMTMSERTSMLMTTNETGMMVYQTTAPKGLYTYDGSWKFHSPIVNGSTAGQTLRWDINAGWVVESNIFNGGGSVGIGTGTNASEKLHIHSGGSDARVHFTNAATSQGPAEGLFIGLLAGSGNGQIMHNEVMPLTFGTSGTEHMRIDPAGNVGIHKTNPTAALDVNGTARIGTNGTVITAILHGSIMIDLPWIASNGEWDQTIVVPNASPTATVHISPSQALSELMIGYSRVSAQDSIQIKFMNMNSAPIDPGEMVFYYTVIQ